MKPDFTIARTQFDGIAAFIRVAELKSFRQAAGELGVSPSAISQTIRALEARIGTALLARTTRTVALTESGRRFLERARPALNELAEAFSTTRDLGEHVSGLLRLSIPRALIGSFVEPVLDEFCAAHPALRVELFADDQLANIVADGFDAGIRLGELVEADMVAIRLTPPFKFAVVGSPAYFAKAGRPQRPEDLRRHRCIGFRRQANGAVYRWEFKRGSRQFSVTVDGPLIVNETALNVVAASKGLGLAYTPLPAAALYLRSGQLDQVLDEFCPASPGMFLHYPSRAHAPPKLRAFVEFARKRLRHAEPADAEIRGPAVSRRRNKSSRKTR